ncbi:MAG: transposase [Candidatus Zixiibacteriota bacterium]
MTDLRHYDHDGRARFITVSTHRRLPLLTSRDVCNTVVEKLLTCCREDKVRLLAYCIMPEHIHFVGIPPIELKFGAFVGKIKMQASVDIHNLFLKSDNSSLQQLTVCRNGEERFAFWMRRCFDYNCRTDEEVREKVNYCHNNPVKRKLVASAELWEWSSYRYHQMDRDYKVEFDIAKIIQD